MAPIPERLQDGVEQSDTWLIPRIPKALEPVPAADEEPLSLQEKCWLSPQMQAARVEKNRAFNERLARFRQEQEEYLSERNKDWAGHIYFHKMFIGCCQDFSSSCCPRIRPGSTPLTR